MGLPTTARRQEQWNVDRQQQTAIEGTSEQQGPSTPRISQEHISMEEEDILSDTDHDPSV